MRIATMTYRTKLLKYNATKIAQIQKVRPDTNYRGCMPAIEKRCKNFEWQGHYEMKCHNYRRGDYMKPITQKKNEWTRKKQLESNINGRNSDNKIWKSKQKYSTQAKSRTPEVRPWTQKQDRLQHGNPTRNQLRSIKNQERPWQTYANSDQPQLGKGRNHQRRGPHLQKKMFTVVPFWTASFNHLVPSS